MRILVIGDAMVDSYWSGSINRLNPEKHSAPLVAVNLQQNFPGGAGNVSKNVAALEAQAVLLTGQGSITKHRVMDEFGVVCRFDVGDSLLPIQAPQLPDHADFHGVIVSDYGKGSMSLAAWEWVRGFGGPIFIDTKMSPKSVDIPTAFFFPNVREYGEHANEYAQMPRVILKKSASGAIFLNHEWEECWVPSLAERVVNVSGAGDTVISAFAVANLCGAEHRASLLFAMAAAAIAVASPWTCAPHLDEVASFIRSSSDATFATMIRDVLKARRG